MNQSIAVEIQTEIQDIPPKTLEEQRIDLRLRLQINRRLIQHKLIGTESESHFPRSAAMRFLARQSTHQIIQKAANAALGIQTFRSLHYGYSVVKFLRSAFAKYKKST
jgi:hypothetical protein